MPIKLDCKILKKEEISDGIFKFTLEADELAKSAKAGNFIEIQVSSTGEPFLRRPISIYNIDGRNIEIIFQVKGRGTELLAKKEIGSQIDIMGPLGFGIFKVKNIKM